jgi:hypothetical protein
MRRAAPISLTVIGSPACTVSRAYDRQFPCSNTPGERERAGPLAWHVVPVDAAHEPAQAAARGKIMADRSNDNPQDPAQMSLGGIVTSLPAVRAAKKANTMSRSRSPRRCRAP